MRDEHVIHILESKPLAEMSEQERATLSAHAESCAECGRALEAAQISSILLNQRAAESFEPSPFFQTRVMAAWRERRAANEPWALWRLWKTAGALVSSMAVTVVALVILTFFAPGAQPTSMSQEATSAYSSYSAEEVIFDPNIQPEDQMSYGQVLSTLYESDEDR